MITQPMKASENIVNLMQQQHQPIHMHLHFHIAYRTQWGEELALEWAHSPAPLLLLGTIDGENWEAAIAFSEIPKSVLPIAYRYVVRSNGNIVRREAGRLPHLIPLFSDSAATVSVRDVWRDLPSENVLFSAAFTGDFIPESPLPIETSRSLTLRVLSPALDALHLHLGILGENEMLGAWDPKQIVPFRQVAENRWMLTLDLEQLKSPCVYKLVAFDPATHRIAAWQNGDNRSLQLPHLPTNAHCVLPEEEIYFPDLPQAVAGTAIPVFSLRSEGSQGVGDFGDLLLMTDWVATTCQRVLQILPINDTTLTGNNTDSYPYNAISVYAFHPMYIDLRQVPRLRNTAKQAEFDRAFRQLNALPTLDYAGVNKLKKDYLLLSFRETGAKLLNTPDFEQFLRKNSHWLKPYAVFSCLRDKYGTSDFTQWPELANYNDASIDKFCQKGSATGEKATYYFYLQYLLHSQLIRAAHHAHTRGVILKGDIPIGIARCSVDAWKEPHYFHLNGSAGAPPDAFSTTGQNWGFPTYNWDAMKLDDYAWWRRRYAHMAQYFSAYRIDHILGFFRIWEIPTHSIQGILGRFVPAMPMSPDEIESFGLPFQKDFMTCPFVCDHILDRLFGHRTEWVKQTFLTHAYYDVWHFRPEFGTQRAIETFFDKEKNKIPDAENLKKGLFSLINNVLFIEDTQMPSRYHPRIAGYQTFVFERLQSSEKEAFRRIHEYFYYHRHNDFWYRSAMEKLPKLCSSTAMLPCGEDLGMVPACVPWAMDHLQLLTLEIERMPKDPCREFDDPDHYPRRSVCTTGTHDMPTFRGWWKEDPARTARYYFEVLHHGGEVPQEAPGWICEEVVCRHINSPSMLCILPLQDWLSIDDQLRNPDADAERINIPAHPRHHWCYRMHLSLESLMKQTSFNTRIAQIIEKGGRCQKF